MSSDFTGLGGFDELTEALEKYSRMADEESVSKAVKAGADAFIKDVRALPRPRSKIGGTHTHMMDTVTTKETGVTGLPAGENTTGAWLRQVPAK